jgi:hypothetical protein
MHWPGAAPILIVSFLMFCAYFLVVKKVSFGPSWLGYLLGLSIAISFISIIFNIQLWPGAALLPKISIPLIYVTLVFAFLKRNLIRPVLLKAVYLLFVFNLLILSPYVRSSILNLNFNYSTYLAQKHKDTIWYKFNNYIARSSEAENGLKGENIHDSLYKYMESFNQEFYNVDSPDLGDLNHISWMIYKHSEDTILLSEALKWSKKTIEAANDWENKDT